MRRILNLMLLLAMFAIMPLLAEEAISPSEAIHATTAVAEQAAPAADNLSITFSEIMVRGGWIMYLITGLSMVAIALAIFYAMTMREKMMFPADFIKQAKGLADAKDLISLREACIENQSTAAKIIAASLEQVEPGQPIDYDRLKDAMEDEGGRQAGILWQRLQYLMDVAVISPMVGLLGTVWGMMLSFGGIENGADFAKKAETMANGISQAMYTTFGGLIVGIFAMTLYGIARGHLNKLIGQMESACNAILRRIAPAAKQ